VLNLVARTALTHHGTAMKLSEYLDQPGASMAHFARRVGVSKSMISRICAGKRIPSARVAYLIVNATEGLVTIDELLEPAKPQAKKKRRKAA
jgi:transcriptional regulator with XRE-family HTH domain